jgi:uncharacterized protein involved in exopolysaccharide biosynthesis
VLLKKFRKGLTVRRIGVSHAIDVFYTAGDPALAARIANEVADSYVRFQLESRTNAARVGSHWLEERLSELRHAMNAASRKMQEHRASQDYSIVRKIDGLPGPMDVNQAQPLDNARSEALTLEELESTATTYRRIYESVLQSFMSAVQRQSFPIPSAQVITRASGSLAQGRPAMLILLLAAVLGACAGAVFGWRRMPA